MLGLNPTILNPRLEIPNPQSPVICLLWDMLQERSKPLLYDKRGRIVNPELDSRVHDYHLFVSRHGHSLWAH